MTAPDLLRVARSPVALLTIAAAVLALLLAGPAAAQSAAEKIQAAQKDIGQRLAYMDATAATVEAIAGVENVDPQALDRLRETMSEQRAEARLMVEELTAAVTPLRSQLEALGPAPEEGAAAEAEDVARSRAQLTERLTTAEGRLKRAELAAQRASDLLEGLASRQREIVAARLLSQGPSVLSLEAWRAALTAIPEILGAFAAGAADVAEAAGWMGAISSVAGVAAVIVLLYGQALNPLGRLIDRLVAEARSTRSSGRRIAISFALVVVRVAPPAIIATVSAWAVLRFGALGPAGAMFVERLAEATVIVFFAAAVGRIVFSPSVPEHRLVALEDGPAWRAFEQSVLLTVLVCGGRLALDPAAELGAAPEFLALANLAIAALAAPMIYLLTRAICAPAMRARAATAADGAEPEEAGAVVALLGLLRMIGYGMAIAIPLSAAFGFYALSRFLLERTGLTAALAIGLVLAFVAVRQLLSAPIGAGQDSAAEGEGAAPAEETAAKTIAPSLAPAITVTILTMLAAPVLALIWGASSADLSVFIGDLISGVEIGGATYSVVDLLLGFAVFAIGVWITRFLQRLLRRDVLPNTSLDAGMRSSINAGLGYLGFIVTALIAVSTAGLDLSNIAIVAGALSVGIGFGLQQIVNNFVSGLILLVERPIKVGDWIVVGDKQGYVRRINVRATEIETFDRSSVIVPNSELISASVTNWTHTNLTGRVIVQVGVSYDSDPEKVAQILREIASAHPMALRFPAPFICFSGFGDSALDFEIRMMIRDVNYMLSVKNEVNHAIFKRFKEAGIEIPFPQRDLNLRTAPIQIAAPAEITDGLPPASPAPTGAPT